jgi:hypothetical protein
VLYPVTNNVINMLKLQCLAFFGQRHLEIGNLTDSMEQVLDFYTGANATTIACGQGERYWSFLGSRQQCFNSSNSGGMHIPCIAGRNEYHSLQVHCNMKQQLDPEEQKSLAEVLCLDLRHTTSVIVCLLRFMCT